MARKRLEVVVGLFVLLGLACLVWLSVRFGDLQLMGPGHYEVTAVFSDVGGLREGAAVVIAGVDVGMVKTVDLQDYRAKVTMEIDEHVRLPEDTIAAVQTRGLIGEKFISFSPGGSSRLVEPGGRIRDTLPARNLEQMISKFVFGNVEEQ